MGCAMEEPSPVHHSQTSLRQTAPAGVGHRTNGAVDLYSGSPDVLRHRLHLAASIMRKLHMQKVQLEDELALLRRKSPSSPLTERCSHKLTPVPSGEDDASPPVPTDTSKAEIHQSVSLEECPRGLKCVSGEQSHKGLGIANPSSEQAFVCTAGPKANGKAGSLELVELVGRRAPQTLAGHLYTKLENHPNFEATNCPHSGIPKSRSAQLHHDGMASGTARPSMGTWKASSNTREHGGKD
jgi:hypothetical protein